jgi:Haem-binding domain
MTATKRVWLIFGVLFCIIQLARFEKTNPQIDPAKELIANEQVNAILKKSCFDCHSSQSKWPWYTNVAPVSWLVIGHVNDARKWINFSEWESYDEAKKLKLKKLIYREISGAMPLYTYTIAHPSAELSDDDKKILRDWTGVNPNEVSMRD